MSHPKKHNNRKGTFSTHQYTTEGGNNHYAIFGLTKAEREIMEYDMRNFGRRMSECMEKGVAK